MWLRAMGSGQAGSFTHNAYPTIGVEVGLQLVDAETLALTSTSADILAAVPGQYAEQCKPELMQCCLEINTDVCRDLSAVERDLRGKLELAEELVARFNTRLYWAATHRSGEPAEIVRQALSASV